METAFLSDLGLDWETRAPLLLRRNDVPELGPPRLAHLTARDYVRLNYVPEDMFNSYYRFAIVRNPWSRAVALYRHLNFDMGFQDFVDRWLTDQFAKGEAAEKYWFVRPQVEFVKDGGKQLVNDIIHFEKLSEEFGRVVAATGLKTALPHVNRSGDRRGHLSRPGISDSIRALLRPSRREEHDHWKKFYQGDRTAEAVGRLYEADVSSFRYSFDG